MPRIGWRNRQDAAGGLLRIADIVGDLGEPVAAIVAVAERGRQQVGAFQPTELFPMRTVGHHIGHIGAHRPVDQPMGVVIERTGGPELPDLRQIGADVHEFQAMNDRRAVRIRPGRRERLRSVRFPGSRCSGRATGASRARRP